VEQEGVRRARERAADADLVLWVVDAREYFSEQVGAPPDSKAWTIINKVDLLEPDTRQSSESNFKISAARDERKFLASAATGKGMNEVLKVISEYSRTYFGSEPALVARQRQRHLLETALAALDRAQSDRSGEDILAEELRLAAGALGRLTGRVDVEDILDVIFRDFCIGK
jgi:tRNA modification GTPase